MPSLSAQLTNGLFRLMGVKKGLAKYPDRAALRRGFAKKPRPSGDPGPALSKALDVSCRT
jgi:hypothetical protein